MSKMAKLITNTTATPMRIDHNKEDILAPSLVRTAKPPMIDTKIPAPATKNGNATAW